jgi:hypothetical protein
MKFLQPAPLLNSVVRPLARISLEGGLAMRKFVPVAAFLSVLAWAGEGHAEQVTLQIDNVQSDDDGWAITRALARLPDVKVA